VRRARRVQSAVLAVVPPYEVFMVPELSLSVLDAFAQRRSVRAFRSDGVHEDQVRAILDAARLAPSGGNLQPWKVYVVAGEARDALIAAVQAKIAEDPFADESAYPVYPPKLWEPYRTRRFSNGEEMYACLGIAREDKMARLAHLARNFEFFGAPVGLFFALDRRMGPGQHAHLGMFMMAVALAAEAHGIASCMQEAWQTRQKTVAAHLGLPDDEQLYCGMALGYEDDTAPINAMRASRVDLDEFARFDGF